MSAAGCLAATSAAVMRLGTISEYTAQLADAAGDQLGVLGAEVDDEDGVPTRASSHGS